MQHKKKKERLLVAMVMHLSRMIIGHTIWIRNMSTIALTHEDNGSIEYSDGVWQMSFVMY